MQGTRDKGRTDRNVYTWTGLSLLVAGIIIILASLLVLSSLVWLTALGMAALILSFILLALARTIPRVTPEVSMLLLETGIDNIAAVVELGRRLLQPANFGRLRQNMGLLRGATSQPAQQLLNILDFEYRAIEKAAGSHPATAALLRSTERVPAPASVVLISRFNHDAEAVMVATERLQRRGFAMLPLETA